MFDDHGATIAAILHKLGETSVEISPQDLQELPHFYSEIVRTTDDLTGAVTFRLVKVKSSDPELFPSDENLQNDS